MLSIDVDAYPAAAHAYRAQLEGRSMLSRRTNPLPVECVARGYLAGSGWKEYQEKGSVCGIALPSGLRQSDRLPETIFTPAIKATSGHDENISWRECRALLGDDIALQVRDWTIELYEHGRAYAAQKGIIVADTKFEFGMLDDEVILIDECLTPDSSRFWPEDAYSPGSSPPSFDKQFVRDYLESVHWNKQPPAPSLPPEIIARTSEKYLDAFHRFTT
jgi:phosphoribosylaminoimidazole-succinocarboxamide synthase